MFECNNDRLFPEKYTVKDRISITKLKKGDHFYGRRIGKKVYCHLYLIKLWWPFFQIFVYGEVVYAQTWKVLTLKKLYRATLNNFLNQIANMKQFNEQGSQHSLNA